MGSEKGKMEIGDVEGGIKDSNIAQGDINIGIGVNELVAALEKAFGKKDPRPEQVRRQLQEITQTHERLIEWKILHNHMNDLLTKFGQFGTLVNNYYEKSKDEPKKPQENQKKSFVGRLVNNLKDTPTPENTDLNYSTNFMLGENEMDAINDQWRPLNRTVDVLLKWVPTIQYIGETGWSQQARDIRDDIDIHFKEFSVNFNPTQNKNWIHQLKDKKNSFEDFVLVYMEISDSELRKTAEELSNKLFRS